MKEQLSALHEKALREITGAKTEEELQRLETVYLGRKGEFTAILRGLGSLSLVEKKEIGDLANTLKQSLEQAIASVRATMQGERYRRLGEEEWVDVTNPGTALPQGHVHLVTSAAREFERIFSKIGFTRVRHPEVDWDWYAFESLNMPKDHPARDEWETFFVGTPESGIVTDATMGKMVLTPHTSNAQVREMQRTPPPLRMINIAKCYRRQSDASHVPMFHQVEGLCIDEGISLKHLIGTIEYFVKEFFGADRKIRMRPFHFRFTEPSFEVDVSCGVCGGTGKRAGAKCPLCKRGWVEILGAGMTHPNVLRAGGVDPERYGAFAFGFGLERTYMMKEGLSVPDIRLLYQNDLRFLQQL